jgi:TRAP transporter TAXI family solute receptor
MRRWIGLGLLGVALLAFGPSLSWGKEEMKFMRIGGASIGGTWLLYAGKMVQIVEKEFPGIRASALVSGGGQANCVQLQNKKMELGFTHTVTADIAYYAKPPATDRTPDIRHVMSLFPAMIHIIVSNKCPELKEFPDLYKKPYRMSVQSKTQYEYINQILELYNMSLEEFKKKGGKLSFLGIGNMANMMQDGNLDVGVIQDPYRSGGIMQVDQNPGIHFLPIKVDAFVAKYPAWIKTKIPKGTYNSVKEDYDGLAMLNSVVCHKDMPDEFVYKLLEAVTKNLDILNEVIPDGLKVKPQDMPVGFSIPIHPGAKKFYEDRGLMKK